MGGGVSAKKHDQLETCVYITNMPYTVIHHTSWFASSITAATILGVILIYTQTQYNQ
jgi:hypothetical protein